MPDGCGKSEASVAISPGAQLSKLILRLPPEAILLSQLDTIELHHGPYSADPPYTQLEVFGTALSEEMRTELRQYGFNEFQPTAEGFRCSRPMPTKES